MRPHARPFSVRRMVAGVARLALIVTLAAGVGSLLNAFSASLERQPTPAGLGRGMLQGILMPMSLPNLLAGRDVAIYAERNSGVPYKLGYTLGVNLCGAVFFGLFFRRVRRWSGKAAATKPSGSAAQPGNKRG